MLNIGPQELLLILIIALVVVGPKRLPELGRTLGKGLREIRKAQDEVKRTVKDTVAGDGRPAFSSATKGPGAEASGDPGGESVAGDGDDAAASGANPMGDITEISKTLGRGLAELRRTRQDIQRSFRVDLGSLATGAAAAPKTRATPKSPAAPTAPAAEPSESSDGSAAG